MNNDEGKNTGKDFDNLNSLIQSEPQTQDQDSSETDVASFSPTQNADQRQESIEISLDGVEQNEQEGTEEQRQESIEISLDGVEQNEQEGTEEQRQNVENPIIAKKSGFENDFLQLIGEAERLVRSDIEESEEEYVVTFNEDEHVNTYKDNVQLKNSVDSLFDALNISINNLGIVDIEYISTMTGIGITGVIEGLKRVIYRNPLTWNEVYYKGFETASEYLSGNLYQKLIEAIRANIKYKGMFEDNLVALKEVMPRTAKVFNGDITLGNPLIEKELVEGFLSDVIFSNSAGYKVHFKVTKSKLLNKWSINGYQSFNNFGNAEYGTDYMPAVKIVEKLLNFQSLEMYMTVRDGVLTTRVIDAVRTEEVRAYANKINIAFQKYINEDEKRIDSIKRKYYETFECYRPRVYDGSYLTLSDKNPAIELKDFQLNAIARIIQTPNTLLAHYVGAGKTYVMVAAGMELRRLGISKRNWYVVPNHLVEQWQREFLTLYPKAKLMVLSPRTFKKSRRKEIIDQISSCDDYDAVIIAYSSMEFLTISAEEASKSYKDFLALLEEEAKNKRELALTISTLIKTTRKKLEAREKQKQELPFFESLKIDTLFVDEAHNYKNYMIETDIKYISGINMNYSMKCMEMMEKVRYTQKKGRGVVFATATPITNSFTDIFVFQKYLQNELLQFTELESFDNWAGMYAQAEENLELDATGYRYRVKNRFTKFKNLPELSNMVSGIADVNTNSAADLFGTEVITQNVITPKSEELKKYIKALVKRAEMVRKRAVPLAEDNMLKITVDGRKAALDIRLVESWRPYTSSSRIAACCEKVLEIYRNGEQNKLTQLIFCDQSTPKRAGVFNIYDDLKMHLIELGIPEEQIAFVHSAKNEKQVEEMHEKTRKGIIRVLIGSTQKLGIGANVQERLVAIHHLDVPWRPCDMIQREGRIKRPGNMNKRLFIYRYIVTGSFDAYSWQLLESKQKLISQFLSGEFPAKETNYVDETVLSYAEVKALAVENPKIKELLGLENEIRRLSILKTQFLREQERAAQALLHKPLELAERLKKAEEYQKDAELYNANKSDAFRMELISVSNRKVVYIDKEDAARELIDLMYIYTDEDKVVGSYCGFDVVIPEGLDVVKYIYLKGAATHRIEGLMEPIRLINRIDAMLSTLEEYAKNYVERSGVLRQEVEFYEKKVSASFDKEMELKLLQDKYMELAEQFEEDKKDDE